jgi:ferritin-like metal-binding protein YciE
VLESFPSGPLEQVLDNYATQLKARMAALDLIIAVSGARGRHLDGAMRALIKETRKMARVDSAQVRGAALLASLQRLIHFMIAGYGAVATYAATLDRGDEARRFHDYVEHEQEVDQQLTALAKAMTLPEARAQSST